MIQKGKVPRPLNLFVHDIATLATHHTNKQPKINQKQKTFNLGNYKE